MAVRGLGCPVRFHLTAGQRGDAPQALTLIEDLPAEVVMADTAYDSDPIRQSACACPREPGNASSKSKLQRVYDPALSGSVRAADCEICAL
ncbi:MAG: hypothetical protein JWQ46_1682 [Phenylobacterium sp.]|nr:hypothetical protein [Phenylobacterium sp.]